MLRYEREDLFQKWQGNFDDRSHILPSLSSIPTVMHYIVAEFVQRIPALAFGAHEALTPAFRD